MAKLSKIKYKLIKTDAGELINPNLDKLNQQLSELVPGIYVVIIEKESIELSKKKRFYFLMESKLAAHIGYTKKELHEILKSHIGHVIDGELGVSKYESIASVKSDERMMERILELQQFAANHFNYKMEPYMEE